MRVLLGLIALLCSARSQDSCSLRLRAVSASWLCRGSGYNCTVESEITLKCRVQVDGRGPAHNIRWFSSNTSDWEAGGTLHNGTLTRRRPRFGQTIISSNITVPLSAGYWWCEVARNEETLSCSEMHIFHISQCSCAAESPADCRSSLDKCNNIGRIAPCSPSPGSLFCLMRSIVNQVLPRSTDSIFEAEPTIRMPPRSMPTLSRSQTRKFESPPETSIMVATTMPTFQTPRSSESLSETKTTITETTYAKTIPPEAGDGVELLPVVVAPVAAVTLAVLIVVLMVIFTAVCLYRIKRVKSDNGSSTDTDEHIYDTVKATTDDQHYNTKPVSLVSTDAAADYVEPLSSLRAAENMMPQMSYVNPVYHELFGPTGDNTPTPVSLVSTDAAADYEEPRASLRAAGNERPQMDSVNPVYLELCGPTEDDTSNDQAIYY